MECGDVIVRAYGGANEDVAMRMRRVAAVVEEGLRWEVLCTRRLLRFAS